MEVNLFDYLEFWSPVIVPVVLFFAGEILATLVVDIDLNDEDRRLVSGIFGFKSIADIMPRVHGGIYLALLGISLQISSFLGDNSAIDIGQGGIVIAVQILLWLLGSKLWKEPNKIRVNKVMSAIKSTPDRAVYLSGKETRGIIYRWWLVAVTGILALCLHYLYFLDFI